MYYLVQSSELNSVGECMFSVYKEGVLGGKEVVSGLEYTEALEILDLLNN